MADDAMRGELTERGERRHEKCKWGRLGESYSMPAHLDPTIEGNWTPDVAPLCAWELPEPVPPTLKRRWVGDVEFDRDCAVCDCYAEITPASPGKGE
jgi:hypothetical protein